MDPNSGATGSYFAPESIYCRDTSKCSCDASLRHADTSLSFCDASLSFCDASLRHVDASSCHGDIWPVERAESVKTGASAKVMKTIAQGEDPLELLRPYPGYFLWPRLGSAACRFAERKSSAFPTGCPNHPEAVPPIQGEFPEGE
jgi:hypothetical protein